MHVYLCECMHVCVVCVTQIILCRCLFVPLRCQVKKSVFVIILVTNHPGSVYIKKAEVFMALADYIYESSHESQVMKINILQNRPLSPVPGDRNEYTAKAMTTLT